MFSFYNNLAVRKVLFLLACLATPAISASNKQLESKNGDLLVSASIGDAMILNPVLMGDSASGDICSRVFNGLVRYGPDMKLRGELAERYEVKDGGLTIDFYLRKGVKWHDGHPFSSADVKFTFDTLMAPETRTPYRSNYEMVKSVEVLGPLRVRVRYQKAFSPALESWGMGMLPAHLLKGKDINTAAFNRAPVGTGPFKFKEWKTNEKITLSVNTEYFEGRPGLAGLVIRVIPDQPVQFLELQAGNIDEVGLSPDLYETRAATAKFLSKYRRFSYPSYNYVYLGFNLTRPMFQDRRVREAITLAINRSALVKGLLRGHGTEITGPFLPELWAYDRSIKPLPYDPKKALRLLGEAGWKINPKSGMLADAGGKPFKFTVVTNQGNRVREQCATAIQWMLKEVGIATEVRVVAWPTFIAEFVNKRKFDAVILGWSLGLDPDQYDIWHSSKTAEHEYNFIGYKNREVDRLLVRGRESFDLTERRRVYNRIHAILAHDLPYVFLFAPEALVALDNRFEGVKQTPIGISWNIHEWYVTPARQRYLMAE